MMLRTKIIPIQRILDDICDDLQLSPANITIDIRRLRGFLGYCLYPTCIQMDYRLSLVLFVETLAHELQHWKDYVQKRIIDIPGNCVEWEGKMYPSNYRVGYTNYSNKPWEIVAEMYAQDYMQRRGKKLVETIESGS